MPTLGDVRRLRHVVAKNRRENGGMTDEQRDYARQCLIATENVFASERGVESRRELKHYNNDAVLGERSLRHYQGTQAYLEKIGVIDSV